MTDTTQSTQHTRITLILITLFASAILSGAAFGDTPQVAATYPERWEYRVVTLDAIYDPVQPLNSPNLKPFEDGLNKFGADGWELVALDVQHNQRRIAIFKRPIKQKSK